MGARLETAPNRLRWKAAWVRLLGKRPDAEVAAIVGCHYTTVVAERLRRGIGPFVPRRARIVWTRAMIRLLGKAFDYEVAAELGFDKASVHRKRKLLGIAPFGRVSRSYDRDFWTARRIALLGTCPDRELAERWRVPLAGVQYRRQMEHIPAFLEVGPYRPWRAREIALLGTATDVVVARRLKRPMSKVTQERTRRGVPAFRPPTRALVRTRALGELLRLRNAEVARRLGVSLGTVSHLRRDYGIPSPPRPTVWTPEVLALVGHIPDEELARRIGRKPSTVAAKRKALRRLLPRGGARRRAG